MMATASPPIALPGCQDHCGNIAIPYPFGIGSACSLTSSFQILCNSSSNNNPIPYFSSLIWNYTNSDTNRPVEITSIDTTPTSLLSSTDHLLLTLTIRAPNFTYENHKYHERTIDLQELKHLDMRGTPFKLVPLLNTLAAIGCGGTAVLGNSDNEIVVGCTTVCPDANSTTTTTSSTVLRNGTGTSCYGDGCCQASVPTSLDYFSVESGVFIQGSKEASNLDVITVVSTSSLHNLTMSSSQDYATILEWRILELPDNVPNVSSAYCSNDTLEGGGYYCQCKNDFYHGNPYLPQGCQVIEECEQCPDH